MNTSFLLEKLNIPTEWIPQFGEVGLVKMSGDSMIPTIQNKDVVAIDFTDQFQTNGVYAVVIDGTVGLARLQKKFDSIRITYDNERYEELDTANAPPGSFQIVGKAVAGWVAF
jgi:phage repressor protein C with HTH and peptisase S24 domain